MNLGDDLHQEVKLRISSEHQGRKFAGSRDVLQMGGVGWRSSMGTSTCCDKPQLQSVETFFLVTSDLLIFLVGDVRPISQKKKKKDL